MDWAEKAAQKALERERSQKQNTEKENRDYRIRAEVGPKLFAGLLEWMSVQVTKYNQLRGRNELIVDTENSKDADPDVLFDTIVVKRRDGSSGPLRIIFSAVTGTLEYQCGKKNQVFSSSGRFTLKVEPDGSASFRSSSGEAKNIAEIGEEMLATLDKLSDMLSA
jgi:hypothetical protein